MTRLLFLALFSIYTHSPHMACIQQRRDAIVTVAEAAEASYGVPAGLLLVVGFLESHLGCHPASGGCWGAPIDVRHRGTAGTPNHAARALARSFEVCGTWETAVNRFRCGLCHCPPSRGYDARAAIGLTERVYARAEQPLPEHLHRTDPPVCHRRTHDPVCRGAGALSRLAPTAPRPTDPALRQTP